MADSGKRKRRPHGFTFDLGVDEPVDLPKKIKWEEVVLDDSFGALITSATSTSTSTSTMSSTPKKSTVESASTCNTLQKFHKIFVHAV